MRLPINMLSTLPFTFGIPLIGRAAAANWPLVEALLDLTLASVRAQTDQQFAIVIAGHDRPRADWADPRITFLQADWPARDPRSDNLDSGRKKHEISQFVLRRGGGLLMFLDADDWIDTRLVETARAMIGPEHVGGIVETGYATDLRSLRVAPLPHPQVFDLAFHRVCGSCTIARLDPGESDPLYRDPSSILHDHHRWIETARAHGADFVRLPVKGNYLINTSENHSERHGPFAEWRQSFTDRVNRASVPLGRDLAARFGLTLEDIRRVSALAAHGLEKA